MYLKTIDEFTIYFNELYKIIMILKIIKEKNNIDHSIYIFIDNQVIIRSLHRLKNQTNQYMLKRIIEFYNELKRKIILQ